MLVESCALFAVSSLLVIGLLVAGNPAVNVFLPILVEIQVRAPPSPLPRLSGELFHVMMGCAGHISATHHPTRRQQESVDK